MDKIFTQIRRRENKKSQPFEMLEEEMPAHDYLLKMVSNLIEKLALVIVGRVKCFSKLNIHCKHFRVKSQSKILPQVHKLTT